MDGMAPTLVDLFCGAGGLSLGFERAGFKLLAAYDHWDVARETYGENIGSHVRAADINASLNLPTATVIAGGPPCQGFSSAGQRRKDDDRNSLVTAFGRLIARQRPLAFVFENVEGFLTGADGRFVIELLNPVIEAGYRVHLRKINAANYGVPQHRKRVIAIGGLGWSPSFPPATHSAFGAPGAHLGGKSLPWTPTLNDAIGGMPPPSLEDPGRPPDHVATWLDGLELERALALAPGQTMRDLPETLWHDSYRRRAFRRVLDGTPTERRGGAPSGLRRLRADEPSKSITGGALRDFLHPTEHRPLTIRECARLQTFSDDFWFKGTKADRAVLIGNAVPPRLAEVLARHLYNELQHAAATDGPGALLSFVPTLSSGMSPVLASITERVHLKFGARKQEVQSLLWN